MKRSNSGPPVGSAASGKRSAHASPEAPDQAQVRSACRTLLGKVLGSACAAAPDAQAEAARVVGCIEEALFERHGRTTGKEYKAAGRSLSLNLRRNASLTRQVVEGELEAPRLVRMEWQEMSTDEQRQQDTKIQAKLMRMATLHDASALAQGSGDAEYTCPQCQSKACEVLDAGRRDIGKCETWGTKSSDDRERLVTCLSCSHRWEVSGLV